MRAPGALDVDQRRAAERPLERDSRTGRKFVGVAPYERFEAWNQAHQLALAVYRVTQSFPRHELYGLTSQARRAAFSVAANIAEGSAKRGGREFARFLDIALGSLSAVVVYHVLRLLGRRTKLIEYKGVPASSCR